MIPGVDLCRKWRWITNSNKSQLPDELAGVESDIMLIYIKEKKLVGKNPRIRPESVKTKATRTVGYEKCR